MFLDSLQKAGKVSQTFKNYESLLSVQSLKQLKTNFKLAQK
jgi:hypothetical protein